MPASIQVNCSSEDIEALPSQLTGLGFSASTLPAADSNQGANSGSITTPAAEGDLGTVADNVSFRDRWTKEQWDEWNAQWDAKA